MGDRYTHKSLTEVRDAAPQFGLGDSQEARYATGELEAEQTGLSFHRVKPGRRQGFGHRHDAVEEIYVVVSGSGRMKLDDEVIELKPLDAVRVSAGITRAFEAGDDGLEVVAVSPHRADDRGELIHGWWSD